jgi:hypothetical protein
MTKISNSSTAKNNNKKKKEREREKEGKFVKRAGDTAQWHSTCLACAKSWV